MVDLWINTQPQWSCLAPNQGLLLVSSKSIQHTSITQKNGEGIIKRVTFTSFWTLTWSLSLSLDCSFTTSEPCCSNEAFNWIAILQHFYCPSNSMRYFFSNLLKFPPSFPLHMSFTTLLIPKILGNQNLVIGNIRQALENIILIFLKNIFKW